MWAIQPICRMRSTRVWTVLGRGRAAFGRAGPRAPPRALLRSVAGRTYRTIIDSGSATTAARRRRTGGPAAPTAPTTPAVPTPLHRPEGSANSTAPQQDRRDRLQAGDHRGDRGAGARMPVSSSIIASTVLTPAIAIDPAEQIGRRPPVERRRAGSRPRCARPPPRSRSARWRSIRSATAPAACPCRRSRSCRPPPSRARTAPRSRRRSPTPGPSSVSADPADGESEGGEHPHAAVVPVGSPTLTSTTITGIVYEQQRGEPDRQALQSEEVEPALGRRTSTDAHQPAAATGHDPVRPAGA